MRIPSSQGNSTLLTASFSSSATVSSADSNENQSLLNSALTQLAAAINSGDMIEAKRYLSVVKQLSSSNSGANSSLSQSVSILSSDLSQNNVKGAQSAVQDLVRYASTSSAQRTAQTTAITSLNQSPLNAIGQDVMDLSGAITSGDLAGAKSAYDSLKRALTGNTGAISSGTTINSGSTGDSMAASLAQIGSALGSGDLSSARSALDPFLRSLSVGFIVAAEA